MKITDKTVYTTTQFVVEVGQRGDIDHEEFLVTHNSEGKTEFSPEWYVETADHDEVEPGILKSSIISLCNIQL